MLDVVAAEIASHRDLTGTGVTGCRDAGIPGSRKHTGLAASEVLEILRIALGASSVEPYIEGDIATVYETLVGQTAANGFDQMA